ncbi:MAG: histidinol-phosphate transaminase [Solirubrobacterales bacterium]
MSVTFAEKLAAIPGYVAGAPAGKAPESIAEEGIAQLASNESPWGPHPAVVEAISRAAAAAHRYPDPSGGLLRRRIAERYEVEPGSVALANGSCEVLLAAALALCEPGAEVVYAWPSFSIYPYLAPLSGAREIRVPLAEGDVHDLDAMLTEITAATQLVLVCNPNNPTSTHIPAARLAEFLDQVPDHVTVIVDEAYVEFQLDDHPDATIDLRRDYPNLVCLRTFSKVYGLAGLRVGYGIGSAKFRAAVDAVRQPFSVNAIAQAAAAEAIRHGDDVTRRIERTIVERVTVQEGVRELGLETPDSHANFSWIDLGDADEGDVVAKLGEAGILVRPGTPLGGPGHIRVSYGTSAENQRFLEALGEAV